MDENQFKKKNKQSKNLKNLKLDTGKKLSKTRNKNSLKTLTDMGEKQLNKLKKILLKMNLQIDTDVNNL